MRRDAIDVQLAKISMAKAQTIKMKRKLTLKLKAVNEATREVKRLKSIYRKNLTCYNERVKVKATKLALKLHCQGPPTDDSSAAATAMNTERTRTSRNNTLLKYGFKKK